MLDIISRFYLGKVEDTITRRLQIGPVLQLVQVSLTLVEDFCSSVFSSKIIQASPPSAEEVTISSSHAVTMVSSYSPGECSNHMGPLGGVLGINSIIPQLFQQQREVLC